MTEKYLKLKAQAQAHVDKLYENKLVIKVQTGTSGQALGADEILNTLLSKANKKNNYFRSWIYGIYVFRAHNCCSSK